MECVSLDVEAVCKVAELVFLALPHGVSMKYAPGLIAAGKRVIDLSADYRFSEEKAYSDWYGRPHESADLLGEAVYGLPELYRPMIEKATLLANPGCYPTGAILSLAPLVEKGLVELDRIVVDAKSGVTGAGRKATLPLLFPECNESFRAYKIGVHQHAPEIETQVSKLAGKGVKILFAPHLVPMNRGILSTVYCRPVKELSDGELRDLYLSYYKDEPFIRIMEKGKYADTKYVTGLNHCDISLHTHGRSGTVIAVAAIDNLVKGAAGQAVQNMNIMYGLPQTTGLI
jgi:N-acetyl-gamma-glutamyl-phosphate reductase